MSLFDGPEMLPWAGLSVSIGVTGVASLECLTAATGDIPGRCCGRHCPRGRSGGQGMPGMSSFAGALKPSLVGSETCEILLAYCIAKFRSSDVCS